MANKSLRNSLVDALLGCRHVRQSSSRNTIVESLSPDLRCRIQRDNIARVDVINIVNACYDWEGGLDDLIEAVRGFEGDGSIPFREVLKVYKQINVPLLPALQEEIGFASLIRRLCEQIGWTINKIDDRHALLQFEMNTGSTQTVIIEPFDSTLEFSVPSRLRYDSESDLPHELSTLLLWRNAQTRYAFWTIQETEDRCQYSCMQNAETEHLDVAYFRTLVETLIGESDAFEQLLEEIDREPPLRKIEDSPRWLGFHF